MRAAVGRGNRVAVGGYEPVGIRSPCDSPLAAAMAAGAARPAFEDVRMHKRIVMDRGGEEVLKPVGEMECLLLGHVLDAAQKLRRARPANFHSAEQIRLRAGHLEDALRLEGGFAAEDLRV